MIEAAPSDLLREITEAYHAKYDRYGPAIVGTVVSAESIESTLRLRPQ